MPQQYSGYNNNELLILLSKDDEHAFTEIYERFWDKLFYVASVKSGQVSIAEEIVQDIFLDIWNRRASLHIEQDLEHYLAVCVKYKVINVQARQKRERSYKAHLMIQQEQSLNHVEQQLSFNDLKHSLETHIEKLPEKCRITYKLKEDGLSQKQIAQIMHVSEKAVEANLSRAMKSLRLTLKNMFSSFFSL